MAYCVRCGVKLSQGSHYCALCKTEVVLPKDMEENDSSPLFDQRLPEKGSKGVSKTKKGFIELVISLFVVSELSVFFSMWLSNTLNHSFIPMFSIAMATLTLITVVLSKPCYVSQASVLSLLVILYLLGLDFHNLTLSWSLLAAISVALFWVLFVFPFSSWAKSHLKYATLIVLLLLVLYLLIMNLLLARALTWFAPVGLMQLFVVLALVFLFFLWLTKRKNKKIPIADIIFGSLFVVLLSLSVFDLLLTKYQIGTYSLRWSESLFFASMIILVFLTGISVSRRLRRFFTSHNLHS